MAVGVGHELVGFFGGGIEAHGMVDIVMDGKRHAGVGAIDRTGGRIDEMLDAVVAAAFENIAEADEVGVDVGVRDSRSSSARPPAPRD